MLIDELDPPARRAARRFRLEAPTFNEHLLESTLDPAAMRALLRAELVSRRLVNGIGAISLTPAGQWEVARKWPKAAISLK
jgi:hypothetical protein